MNYRIIISLLFIALTSCRQEESVKSINFTLLDGQQTGLNFSNDLALSTQMNIFKYMYFYNGGGVGVADFNNDGLNDVFLTSNLGANKLFVNKGNMQFADVTNQTNITKDSAWSNGVSVVDINQDGKMDIYISQVGNFLDFKGHNLLYVCESIKDGVPTYVERSHEYGLDFVGFGTQAAFFDYDLDGDLDVYLLNHSLHANGTFGEKKSFVGTVHPESGDKLYKNENGKYHDVTLGSGIQSTVIGYGLGIVVSDINMDGWPDIYVGNDFHEDDYLYINQGNGTFKESLSQQMMHTSRFSMGVDAADLNGDGYNEIISLDMLPEDPYILKKSIGEDDISTFNFKLDYGYKMQYSRNCLQLNNCNGTFSEIGTYSGVHNTDWSWAPLMMDFTGDGNKDLFIGNGIPKRMNDIDYVNFVSNEDWQWKTRMGDLSEGELKMITDIPEIKNTNKFFIGSDSLKFFDASEMIAGKIPSYTNGTAWGDLDNDGDLDLICNNINEQPFIYRNEAKMPESKFIKFELEGKKGNKNAIGAKILLKTGDKWITYEHYPVRGFQGSSAQQPVMGVGNKSIESIYVVWPDQGFEVLSKWSDTTINKLSYKENLPRFEFGKFAVPEKVYDFVVINDEINLHYKHQENEFLEFHREPLIPHSSGEEGPAVSIGDMNGDGLDDLFFGAAKWQKSTIYFQQKEGTFTVEPQPELVADSTFEDVSSILLDIDNDKDLDLIVASGGNEYAPTSEFMHPRCYINDGKGHFKKDTSAFPNDVGGNAQVVVSMDINGDNFKDLFIGIRTNSRAYGEIPSSYLLVNNGKGKFTNQIKNICPVLEYRGMVKAALTADLVGDNKEELIVAYEWDGIYMYQIEGSSLKETRILEKNGWWHSLSLIDANQDGKKDILVGNNGENCYLQPTANEVITMYYDDFDKNGVKEQFITFFKQGREIPFATMMELQKKLPFLKKKFLKADAFSKAKITELIDENALLKAEKFTYDFGENCLLINLGNGQFVNESLSYQSQFSPITAALPISENLTLLGYNAYNESIQVGRMDAGYLNMLQSNKDGRKIIKISPAINGVIKHILPLSVKNKSCYLVVRNDDNALIIREK